MAILSNVDRALIATSIEKLGITFDMVVTAEDCQSYKPNEGHWKYFERQTGAAIDDVIHVGASMFHDMIPTSRMGYKNIFINRHDEPVKLVYPNAVLLDLKTLPATIDSILREA